jgi:hypothetical protein
MSLFKTVMLTQITFGAGSRVKGVWVPGAAEPHPFRGTVRPTPGKVLELLPEGKRNTDSVSVFAPISLDFTTSDPERQRNGDLIVWEGREYEVQIARKCNSHPARILHHWELVATRKKEGQK